MHRRSFLAGLAGLAALPFAAQAQTRSLNLGVYPGTGKADIVMGDFRAYAMPFAQALGAAINAQPKLTLFRSIRSVMNSLKSGRLDLYFVPPTVAVAVLDHDYSPVVRVRDEATGMMVRRKGVTQIEAVAFTEKESWLDVMGRWTLKQNKHTGLKTYNFKTQDDVALAIERNYAQAGSLRVSKAKQMIEKGLVEIWYELPKTPDFTLMASNRLSQAERDRLGAAAASLAQPVIDSLQQTIHSKVTGFVIDKQADYQIIKRAMKDAGY
ncbi:MAG: PhnD/SsuA/transferrin family substrate-binding protein [Pseudomonadota bacterium]